MVYETALGEQANQRLDEIGHADILVGIPSYNNAATIGFVVESAAQGLARFFPDMRSVIMNSDGGSSDNTCQTVLRTGVHADAEIIADRYQGLAGKGSALRAVFEAGRRLGVQLCLVLDGDLRSITPEWIDLLARPVSQQEYDYVAPCYTRHKYDGTITNNIVYPMTRMLYGVDVRQPIGGDFAFAGWLLDTYLGQDVWQSDVARFGIDIWMTTTAINEGARVCQVYLGTKIHDARDPAASLGPMFRQVVGTLFGLMQRYAARWKNVAGCQPARLYGKQEETEPEPVPVTLRAMIDKFHSSCDEWGDMWDAVLSPRNRRVLREITELDSASFHFSAEDWADIVLDYAVAYNRSGLDRNQVIDSMVPLYYGRTAGMVIQSRTMDVPTFEREIVQAQANLFERLKPELVARWDQASD
jgi:glycosyltransferase involved in cell wall biosynthesis